MTSEHFANGARKHLMAAAIPTKMKTMTIQTNELTVVNIGETEVLRDRLRHQGLHGLDPQPLADRVPQLPMDLVKRRPSATRRCTSQHPASDCQTQCILRV